MSDPANNSQQSANTEPAKKAPAKKAPAKKAPAKKAPAKKAPAKKAPATDPYGKASNLGASSFATLRLVEVHCDEAVNSRTTHIVKLASYARANPRVRAIVFEQLARVENGSVPYDAPQNELVVRMLGDLLMTIPTIGLQEPPSIRYIRRTPHLHVGYRRYAALLFLYGPDYKQLFSVTTIDGDDQLIANLTENVARRSLTSYEEATRYSEIRDNDPKRWTPAMLAARTSRSPSHVENLMRARSKLHPTLVEQWKVLGHTAPLKVLISICSKKLSEQLAAWRDYTEGSRAGGEPKVRFAVPPMTVRAMQARLRPYREQASPSWLASGGSSYLEGAEAAFSSVLDGFPFELPHGAVDDPDDDDVTASPIPSFHSAVPPMGDPSQPQEHAD